MSRPSILVILSSSDRGWYLAEFAHPYKVLLPHCDITTASSEGGSSAIVDPVSIEQFKGGAYCVEFLDTKQDLWKHTEKPDTFLGRAKEFAAILYVGGFGPTFDLIDNKVSFKLIREFHEAGRVVGAVCHGSAALVNATLADGTKLIAGEAVTGFSNEEEVIAKRPQDMPFLLEDALNEASGGKYEKAEEPWAPHVVTSALKTKSLLTGQNPASARGFAEELLKFIQTS